MVYKLLIYLLFIVSVNAQNVWYVNANNTSGTYNGRSFETGWRYFDSSAWAGTNGINWSIIGSGDTIYISGGTDSLVYTPSLGANNSYGLWISPNSTIIVPGNPAVIAPAWHEGHNGKVVLAVIDTNSAILRIRNLSNIKITGITFYDLRDPEGGGLFVMIGDEGVSTSSNIHIDNCTFIGQSKSNLVHFDDVVNWTISNCHFEHTLNDSPNDCDPITTFFGGGTILIENNTVIQRNTNIGTDAHRDMIQFGYMNRASGAEIVIRNNFFGQIGQASSWNAIMYNSISYVPTKWYIYNNVMVSTTDESSIGGIFIYNSEGESESFWVFNNTIIINNDESGLSLPISTGSTGTTDTIVYKNNLVITDAPVNIMFNAPGKYFGDYYRKIDYNGWFEYGGLSGNFMPGNGFGAWTYSQWQADDPENDAHSITGDSDTVTFANKYGETFEDYYTTTGRGLGVNLLDEHPEIVAKFPDIMFDALGNPRPEEGAWDIGALQYIDSEEPDTIPNTFTFNAVTNAELNTSYESNTNTLAGIDEGESCTIWIVDGEYQINSEAWTSSSGTIGLGDDFKVRRNSHATLYEQPVSCTLYISTRSAAFTITTKAEPPPPEPSAGGWAKGSDGKRWFTSGGKRFIVASDSYFLMSNEGDYLYSNEGDQLKSRR